MGDPRLIAHVETDVLIIGAGGDGMYVERARIVLASADRRSAHQATHWTARAMAKAIGISVGSVQRIWRAHKLQPHRLRTFKRSRDSGFAAKLTDIVGLYVDPPALAVVLSR